MDTIRKPNDSVHSRHDGPNIHHRYEEEAASTRQPPSSQLQILRFGSVDVDHYPIQQIKKARESFHIIRLVPLSQARRIFCPQVRHAHPSGWLSAYCSFICSTSGPCSPFLSSCSSHRVRQTRTHDPPRPARRL